MTIPYFGSLPFFLYFIYFLFSVFLAWYVPGNLVIRKISLGRFEKNILSLLVGLVLWGWQGFLFGYLNMRWLSYLYIVIFFLLFIKNINPKQIKFKKLNFNPLIILILTTGVFLQIIGVFFMGARFPDRIVLCCGVTPDNNLELSIINEITQRFPPFEPGWYGHPLVNYHYWSHLVLAELVRVFKLPLVTTVYQYSTLLFSILFGLSLIAISKMLKMKKEFIYWLLFFSYFGGDAAYLIPIIQGKGLGVPFEALEHAAQFFLNYPRAISIIVFLGGLMIFLQWIKDKKKSTGIILGLMFGSLIGFKVYTGIFVLTGCVVYGLFMLSKKEIKTTLPLFLTAFLSAIIYFPVNSKAGGLFYTGFWRANDFIVLPGLNLSHLELAREIYEKGGNILRVLSFELLFTLVYIFITFGTKLIGFFQTKKSMKLFPFDLNIFLISGFTASFILGMFFWQKTGGPNTFNFLVTILILIPFYCALAAYYFISKMNNRFAIMATTILILLTIPRIVFFTRDVFKKLSLTEMITIKEQEALKYLKEKTPKDSIYLADPYDDVGLTHYSEYVSPYIPYMTQRLSFLSGIKDEMEAHGIEYKKRFTIVKEIYSNTDSKEIEKLLYANKISYLYMPSTVNLPVATTSTKIRIVFNNDYFKIYRTTK